MKKAIFFILTMAAACIFTGALPAFSAEHAHMEAKNQAATVTKLADLKAGLRDLWIGHVFWVRNVVVATKYGDNEAAKVAEAAVVENAKAIAGSIEPFYGKAASDKLFGLLAGHYGAVKEYMTSAYANDKTGKDSSRDKLIRNADEIAVFLSGANPYLPKETLYGLLTAHGGHHMKEIEALASKNYAEEAQVWSDMKAHMYVIADALAGGLAKQFPEKIR
ncbi:hypothetical protein OR1_03164 [Geobacter sp. OR-1]|uniref:hypothetical protein n=1 Tax=Geobacter sp. OR-1 TaxID=1266765 RepID=UPI00054439DB|nr:hypothetical protein [Geobacter sp. OR-1]GAM10864.1 hypothetical protein OR1_03164 [Geobacter sp. OR-1]